MRRTRTAARSATPPARRRRREPGLLHQQQDLEHVGRRGRPRDDVAPERVAVSARKRVAKHREGADDLSRRRRQRRRVAGNRVAGLGERAGEQRLASSLVEPLVVALVAPPLRAAPRPPACAGRHARGCPAARDESRTPRPGGSRRAGRRRRSGQPAAHAAPARPAQVGEQLGGVGVTLRRALAGRAQRSRASAKNRRYGSSGLRRVSSLASCGKRSAPACSAGSSSGARPVTRLDTDTARRAARRAARGNPAPSAASARASQRHRRGDVGVAVTVAADPGAERQQRGDDDAGTGIAASTASSSSR